MSFTRPQNLTDILKSINDDAGQANNPDLTVDPTFSQLASIDETITMADSGAGSVTATKAAPGTWASGGIFGFQVWTA